MKKKLLILAARLLKMASDEFSNHGSNDIPSEFWKGWTAEEKKQLCEMMAKSNDPTGQDPYPTSIGMIHDDLLMDFLAEYLETLGK